MRNRHVIRLMLACVISLVASATAAARPATQAVKNAPAPKPHANDQPQTFDLADFGATGDGQTDDGPALQAALDALAEAGGGTLLVPAGLYAIVTPVSKDFAGLSSEVAILGVASDVVVPPPTAAGRQLTAGLDLTSHFLPKTGEAQTAVTISGLQSLLIQDISFTGSPEVATDALVTLLLLDIKQATVRHCEFYGVGSFVSDGAILRAVRSRLAVEQTEFLGSGTCSGVYAPVVENVEWKDIAFTSTIFADFGLRPELYGKLQNCSPFSWVEVGNPAAVTPDSPRREAVFRDVFMDEGAFIGLSSAPYHFVPESAPIDLIYVSGLYMNVSNLGESGNYFYGTGAVLVENSGYGWSHNAYAAINLLGVGEAILDRVQTTESATRLSADSATGRLTVIDSTYEDLFSEAAETKVINTSAPDEDPVLYVRGRFEQELGREPDAAAHFYWSSQLLRCGENKVCVEGVRARLSAYLDSRPSPTFVISGRAADENGDPLAGLSIELSGSQSVSTLTGDDGLYSFGPLPTSGVYTVTASTKRYYTFAEPAQTVTTPAASQTVDFDAALDRHAIAGRLLDGSGGALRGATVTISGVKQAAAVTDEGGNFSFKGLPAGGSYTVTPSKLGYEFSPASQSFADLDSDESAPFLVRPLSYALSGRVTFKGAALPGATLTLSGARSESASSGVNGGYSFAVSSEGSYTVTPSKAYYRFTPQSLTFSSLLADKSADFDAAVVTYKISGRVTAQGAALAGVTLDLAGSHPLFGPQTGQAVTGADGAYSFTAPEGGDYTITPSKKNYTFDRAAAKVATLGSDQSADFNGTLQTVLGFGAPAYTVNEGGVGLNVTVTRTGDISKEVWAVYDARGDTARRGADFDAAAGLLTFAPGETAKSFNIFITDDSFVEGPEKFTLTLTAGDGAILGDASSALVTIVDNDTIALTVNPVDDDEFFVREHYRDFLSREPDTEGLNFWTGEIKRCGTDAACREARRVSVSAAFFFSIEFKETGYLVYRLYRATYGRTPKRVSEFMLDSRILGDGVVVGAAGWEERLAANKKAFLAAWTQRTAFKERYANFTDTWFITALFENMGVTPTDAEREALLADLRAGVSRADVLAKVVENAQFNRQEYNKAFVLMQYFGYLRRDPDEAPDTNLDGYNFWLGKLEEFRGDYERAEMVKAFLSSAEYRSRFGN